MKRERKNINLLFVMLLTAAFTISFSHTFIEKVFIPCENHDEHDFSKVIVNASIPVNASDWEGKSNQSVFAITSAIATDLYVLNGVKTDDIYIPPLLYYDKIFITKFRSLII